MKYSTRLMHAGTVMRMEVENLGKIYKSEARALVGANLAPESGMFGLLRPNGADKTPLMKIFVTLMRPSASSMRVDGLGLDAHRAEIRAILGYLSQ